MNPASNLAISTIDETDEPVSSWYQEAPTLLETKSLPGNQDLSAEQENVRRIRRIQPKRTKAYSPSLQFLKIQEWEGQVKSIDVNTFTAILTDKTTAHNNDEEVEIDVNEVMKDDHSLLRAGAVFYWSIGYEEGAGIPRQRVSRIRFRRLPGLTQRELREAETRAAEFAQLFAVT